MRILDASLDNTYVKAKPGDKKIRVQDEVYNYLKNDNEEYLKLNKKN